MGQFLKDARRRGKPFWRTFFMGDAMEGACEDDEPEFAGSFAHMTLKGLYGVNLPWHLALLCLIGVWLMFTRLIFGASGAMANSDHLMGALLITVSVLAMAEVVRPLRLLNIPIGLWLLVAPWLLSGATLAGTVGGLTAGGLIIALSVPLGPIRHSYAGWNRLLRFPLARSRAPEPA
ncbi:SPW repeat domain-containing protein [Azotobacter vinelandii]